MRQSYTPVFHSVLTSRVWALPPAARCVWLWLQLQADPEGYVCADLAGVAVGARVAPQEAREALEVLSLADADADPSDPHEGRLIERVTRGWRVLGFEESRDLAKREARNARTRRYMAKSRAAAKDANEQLLRAYTQGLAEGANDVASVTPCEPIDTPTKTKPKTKTFPEDRESPLPPAAVGSTVVAPRTLQAIPDTWQPSESLRAEAAMAGVTNFDERLAGLRSGPIGGARGVFENQLEHYVRTFFGKWRAWAETDRAKATNAAKPRGGGRFDAVPLLEPTDKHRAFAKKHGLDLDAHVRELQSAVAELGAKRALEMLGERMSLTLRKRQGTKRGEAA